MNPNPNRLNRIKAFFYERVPEGVKPRWHHALAYYSKETRESVMLAWPLNILVALAWWANYQWSCYRFRPSWIDRALKNEPPGLTTRHALFNGSRYPSVSVQWKRDGAWGGGGWTGKVVLWHSGSDRDEHEHTVSIGQGCPLGSVSLYFDSVGYGAWEMASIDGAGITERDLQWATLWAVLALKSRRRMGDLRAIEKTSS